MDEEFYLTVRSFLIAVIVAWVLDGAAWALTFTVNGDIANAALGIAIPLILATAFVVPMYLGARKGRR